MHAYIAILALFQPIASSLRSNFPKLVFGHLHLNIFLQFLQATTQKKWDNYRKAKSWIRSFVIFYFLLGIGFDPLIDWIIGICVLIPNLPCTAFQVLEYLKIVFYGLSGLGIFMYIVLCNTKMKEASKKLIRSSTGVTTKTTKSSPSQNLLRRKTTKKDSGSGITPIFIVNDETPPSTSSRKGK